ncbi:IclR family transcriptional regulator [Brenneria izadpanahii]|uniref:HTH-type transcriptional repressor AllR n=1 Tax=Brenneria izadpanahii TaxID=2722756 RepID=A0ABX7UTG8_9GAMM|nr:IclR family transcriptional regulator [Brenneria izadpanahii]QTF08981.1 IclR family transcriptional regulator [Brenneria izadpanahii]
MKSDSAAGPSGVQTLLRGLSVIDAVAAGHRDLKSIGAYVGTSRSTTHRLVNALVEENLLRLVDKDGYYLGPKLIELGTRSLNAYPLRIAARPTLEALAQLTQDTVHLAIREGNDLLYIDKIPGMRGLEMRSRVGQRMPLSSTGLGKSLLLDDGPEEWKAIFQVNQPSCDAARFIQVMTKYAQGGYSFDLEENEFTIRCVAAPVRDASNRIVAAISVASIAPYMPDSRMSELINIVKGHADAISSEMGWSRALFNMRSRAQAGKK